MAANPGRQGRPWRRARQFVIHYYICPVHGVQHCGICHTYVDITLPGTHRDGPAADHIVKLEDGGAPRDPANLRLVHHRCNSARENHGRKRRREAQVARPSRDW